MAAITICSDSGGAKNKVSHCLHCFPIYFPSIFIARTTIYNDGTFEPVDKYYIAEGTLYKVDTEAQTVTKIADLSDPAIEEAKASLDIYLTFDEIRALYA